jgi:hypothetical protein
MNGAGVMAEPPSPRTPHPVQTGGVHVSIGLQRDHVGEIGVAPVLIVGIREAHALPTRANCKPRPATGRAAWRFGDPLS